MTIYNMPSLSPCLVKYSWNSLSALNSWTKNCLFFTLPKAFRAKMRELIKAPSTRIRFRLKTLLFRCGFVLCPHVSDENGPWKRNLLKTLSRVEFSENAVFVFPCGQGKTELFEKRWRISIGSSPLAQKKMAGYGDFMFLLCIKSKEIC